MVVPRTDIWIGHTEEEGWGWELETVDGAGALLVV
jgi:hypothetical protein